MSSRNFRIAKLIWEVFDIKLSRQSKAKYKIRRAIFDCFVELGGVYLKFLQALALNSDFMTGWSRPGDLAVFENATYDNVAAYRLLSRELGKQGLNEFSSIDGEPFAAGSFGQVYRAKLKSGEDVVIKILKPSIRRHLRSDLKTIKRLVKLANFVKSQNFVNMDLLFEEFYEATIYETDYIREAENGKWFYDYFKANELIVIPKTYQNLSTRHVLTQDYVGGTSLAEMMSLSKFGEDAVAILWQRQQSNLWRQLEIIGDQLVHASLCADYMLGDPHPGNIKLLPGDRIGFIDFGIVAASPANRQAYFEFVRSYQSCFDGSFTAGSFILAMIGFFDENLAKAIKTLETQNKSEHMFAKIDYAANKQFSALMDNGVDVESLMGARIIKIFMQLVNNGNRYGLNMNPELLSLIRAARTYVQVVRQFTKNNEDMVIIHAVLKRETDYILKHPELIFSLDSEPEMSYETAIETLSSWLSQVAENDPSLFTQLNATMGARSYA